MILINLYGKIEPVVLSNKLGIGISNLNDDWRTGIVDDLKEEILLREHFIKSSVRYDFGINIPKYNPEAIATGAKCTEVNPDKHDMYLQEIADNLVQLEVMKFDQSLLQMKNQYLSSPTCEVQYPSKFIRFCHLLTESRSSRRGGAINIPFMTYDPDRDEKPKILNFASIMAERQREDNLYNEKAIQTLKYVGELIDGFLESERDFWIFDYIVNALDESENYNAYYIFKMMSLIEMLIINPKGNGKTKGELERKLPRFLRDEYDSDDDMELFSSIVRKMRNKIAHGDFESFHKLLEEYRVDFMKNFWFDEIEYSIESWTINSICLTLNNALSEILIEYFTDKESFTCFQKS